MIAVCESVGEVGTAFICSLLLFPAPESLSAVEHSPDEENVVAARLYAWSFSMEAKGRLR